MLIHADDLCLDRNAAADDLRIGKSPAKIVDFSDQNTDGSDD